MITHTVDSVPSKYIIRIRVVIIPFHSYKFQAGDGQHVYIWETEDWVVIKPNYIEYSRLKKV